MDDSGLISLADGSGGAEMQKLIADIRDKITIEHSWDNTDDDSATLRLGESSLVFTTDSFVVDPIFFKGGDIGKLAVCGTINDLAVMGAKPVGLSLGIIVEEGFEKSKLLSIMESIAAESKKSGIPIVTGDTKVMEKSKIDKIVINTSGIGIALHVKNDKIEPGDKIIVSGSIAEHGAALLSERFEIDSGILTDSKPLHEEMQAISSLIKQAKDPTRGGIAAILNEMASKSACQINIFDDKIPISEKITSMCNLLGISPYELASEGRLICAAAKEKADEVVGILKKYNPDAAIIGDVQEGKGVVLQTKIGRRLLQNPTGRIVPRIC